MDMFARDSRVFSSKLVFKLKRTTLIIIALGLFLVGLIFARILSWVSIIIAAGFIAVVLIIFLQHKRKIFVIGILILIFFAGILRGIIISGQLNQHKNLIGRSVSMQVTAREDAVYSDRHQLVFSAGSIELIEPNRKKLIGNIEIEGRGVNMVYRGDRLLVKGKLYNRRGDNVSGISFAEVSIIKLSNSRIDGIRRRFTTGLLNVLPEPLASLGLGLLIGQRNTLPKDLSEQLRRVGLVHIVAVSGYNLTVIIYFSQRLMQKRSRFQAIVASSGLIVLFLLVTGFSPSIVRASVVSFVSLVTWYYGRTMRPMMVLLLSAVITAGWNPLYIWSSVGWYLSFMAFFGILILAPLIHQRFIPAKFKNTILLQVLTETTAAQICTLPIILFVFSSLSIISIVANILVVPSTPYVMFATLVAGIYGAVGSFLFGGLLVLPAKIMLSYIVEVTRILSELPFAIAEVKINAYQTAVLTVLIIVATLVLQKSVQSNKLTTRAGSSKV